METLNCPVPHKLIFCRTLGYGKARNVAAKEFGCCGLMVQFNDDLVISPKIWDVILQLKHGEFILTHEGKHLCSRVFAVYLEDFWQLHGCDEKLKYCFEDGDFAFRAQQAGLKLKVLSPDFAKHIPHPHAFYKTKRIVPVTWEFCRMYVKYKRNFDDDPLRFFIPFRDYRVAFQHLLLRVTFTLVWIIKGVNH
ncbi:MAG: hypothetical protein ABSB71_07830 [Candidatus Bathyarchaeia archaeon]